MAHSPITLKRLQAEAERQNFYVLHNEHDGMVALKAYFTYEDGFIPQTVWMSKREAYQWLMGYACAKYEV